MGVKMHNPSDLELMYGISIHDTQSFEDLYARYAPRLLGFIRHIIPDRDESEDVLQHVFLYIWQHPGIYHSERGTVQAYLFRVAKSRAIDFLRKNRRRWEYTVTEDNGAQSLWQDAPIDDRLMAEETLEALSPHERTTIELIVWYGFTQREVSQLLHRPLGTVKSWTRRGLDKLRQQYVNGHKGAE